MIDTIIFDLSEVQMTGLIGVEEHLSQLLKLSKSEVLPRLLGPDIILFFNGKITEDEYISRIINRNKWSIEPATLKRVIRENFREVEGMRDVVEQLRKNGYRLGLLSVHGKEWVEYISERFGHHKLFHSFSYSFESGISKPDKRAYVDILNRLGSRPENTIFIDDSPANLVPAQELGMKTILFTDAIKLKENLELFGVRIKLTHQRIH